MAVQNYTLSGLRTKVKQHINEMTNDGLWTTAELNTYINHAMLRVNLDTRILLNDVSVNVAANVAYYTFASDLLTPLWIYGPSIWGSLRLFPSFLLSLDKQYGGMYQWEKDSANQSQGFVPFSYNQFILWPPPSSNTTVNLHYVPIPAALVNDGDVTAFPLIAQYPVSTFATYLALLKSDVQKAKRILEIYKQRITAVLELTRHQDQTRPTVMVPGRSFDRSMANPSIRAYRNSRRYYSIAGLLVLLSPCLNHTIKQNSKLLWLPVNIGKNVSLTQSTELRTIPGLNPTTIQNEDKQSARLGTKEIAGKRTSGPFIGSLQRNTLNYIPARTDSAPVESQSKPSLANISIKATGHQLTMTTLAAKENVRVASVSGDCFALDATWFSGASVQNLLKFCGRLLTGLIRLSRRYY